MKDDWNMGFSLSQLFSTNTFYILEVDIERKGGNLFWNTDYLDTNVSERYKEQNGGRMKSHKAVTDSRASRRQIPESTWSRCRTRCRAARGACCTSPARYAPGDDPTPPGHPESWLVRSERGCRVPETWYSIGISASKFVSRTIRFIFYL